MTAVVNCGALASALAKVRALVKATQIVPIAGCCRLQCERSRLSITTTNFDIQATAVIDAEPDHACDLALDVHALSAFVSKLPKEAMVTISDEGKISCGRARATISPLPGDSFPDRRKAESMASFSLSPDQVKHLLTTPNRSADTNTIRIYLCGVTMQCVDGEMTCTASDTATVIRVVEEIEAPSFDPIIIPSHAIELLSGMLGEDNIEVDIHESAISFFNADFLLVSRLIGGKAAPFESILKSTFTHRASVNRLSLISAVDRVGCMTDHERSLIKINLSGERATIESAVSGNKSAIEDIDIEHGGDCISLGFNARQLVMLAQVMPSDKIDILYSDALSPTSIYDSGFSGQTVIAHVRV